MSDFTTSWTAARQTSLTLTISWSSPKFMSIESVMLSNDLILWKRSVFIPIPKKGSPKECSNYQSVVLTSHPSKVMLKILQARLQQYLSQELPDIQAGLRKGRGIRDQIANIRWIIEKTREFQKKSTCFLDDAKAFVWITTNCGTNWFLYCIINNDSANIYE